MPIQFNSENGGKILVVHVSGKLVKSDYSDFVAKFEQLLGQHGKLRVLFDMTGLHGWDLGAAWEDLKFDMKHIADIERLAIIGDKKWQHAMAIFFEPFTKATTRYFDHVDAAEARKWLNESGSASVNTRVEDTMKPSVTDKAGPLVTDRNPKIINPAFHYQNRRMTHA